jgi:hypothetical protein
VASSKPYANIHHVCGHAVPLNHTDDQHEECCGHTRRVQAFWTVINCVTFWFMIKMKAFYSKSLSSQWQQSQRLQQEAFQHTFSNCMTTDRCMS